MFLRIILSWIGVCSKEITRDTLCNLVPFVQFKRCEKHPWRSVTFSKVKIARNRDFMQQVTETFILGLIYFSADRDLIRTLSDIYDEAFLRKVLTGFSR